MPWLLLQDQSHLLTAAENKNRIENKQIKATLKERMIR